MLPRLSATPQVRPANCSPQLMRVLACKTIEIMHIYVARLNFGYEPNAYLKMCGCHNCSWVPCGNKPNTLLCFRYKNSETIVCVTIQSKCHHPIRDSTEIKAKRSILFLCLSALYLDDEGGTEASSLISRSEKKKRCRPAAPEGGK